MMIQIAEHYSFKFILSLPAYASGNETVLRPSRFGTSPAGNIMY